METTSILLGLIVGSAWLIAASFYSRQAAWFLLCWIPIQGWIQLNVFDDSNATVLLYEFQVIGLYFVFGFRALRFPEGFRPPSVIWFAVPFAIWALLLIPFSVSTNGGLTTLLGLRSRLLPLPLVWLGYRAFRSRRQLENIGVALMLQLPVVAAVTASQFLSLPSATSGEFGRIPAGFIAVDVIRPPGTFSAPGHLGVYLLIATLLGIGLLGLHVKPWKRIGFVIGLAAATVTLVVNTQRVTIVLLSVILPVVVILARRARAVRIGVVCVGIVVAAGLSGTLVSGDAFSRRVASISDDVRASLVDIPSDRFIDALQTPIIGGGLGTASPGIERLDVPARADVRERIVRTRKPTESFMAALVYETGVPGLLLFYLYIGALLHSGLGALRDCRRSDMGLLAAAILGYEIAICLQSWTYSPLLYPPSRVLFWFWAGVLLSLPKLPANAIFERQTGARRMTDLAARRPGRPPLPSAAASSWVRP